jgi:uncharacterized protein YkwD
MTRSRMLALTAVLVVSLLVPAAQASADSPAQKMIRKVNAYRAHRGVPPLHMSGSLNGSSRKYARHMMRAGYFGHDRRIHASRRFRRLGEIIEMHRGHRLDIRGALRAWASSPGHNAILLDGGFKYVGAGPAMGRFHGERTTMWVMHFGRK